MSANAAEIFTLVYAIRAAKQNGATALLIVGDSQVALKWANVAAGNRRATKIKKTSPEFREAIENLTECMTGMGCVKTQWQPRLKSVETFRH